MHNSHTRRAKWTRYSSICLVVSSIVLFSLISGEANGLQENILYAGTLGNPGKILKIDLTTFQTIDTMTLDSGENAHALTMTDEYLYVGSVTVPARIIQVRLSDFARTNGYTLPSGFNYAMTLHVFGGYLYIALASGQVARMNASTLALVDYALTPAMARDTVQVGSYVYVSSRGDVGGPSYLQKFSASDFAEVGRINLSQSMAHFMLVVDNYLYIASNAAPAGIMKVDLNTFSEVDSVQFGDSSHGAADVIVRYGDYLYANGDSFPGRVYRTRLSDFTYVDYIDLSEDKSAGLEIYGKYLYVSMLIEPSVIIKVDLDTFQEVSKLNTGERAIPQMTSASDIQEVSENLVGAMVLVSILIGVCLYKTRRNPKKSLIS